MLKLSSNKGEIMDLVQVLTVIGVAIANIGTTITLFMWATNRTEENRKETQRLIEAIHQEMKDFHGRLCTIEERNKGR
jgi:hypothetical protein